MFVFDWFYNVLGYLGTFTFPALDIPCGWMRLSGGLDREGRIDPLDIRPEDPGIRRMNALVLFAWRPPISGEIRGRRLDMELRH